MKLEYVIYVDASPEKVWEALVSPEGTRAVFFGSRLKSSFEVGAPFEYVGPGSDGGETVHVYGGVLAFEPGRRLSYSEHPGPSYYDNHAELRTRVTFELEPSGSCTKLTLINDEWTENHPGFGNASGAWPMVISSIKTWCETGKTLDFGW
ncbi:SRPBCC family protein [Saccharibacillus alkalitolerans]|uniref:Polyketide cyclase n=1 Tax=Saccharibacillus alkalitolerans TaxID=2705290 RepID=A0ABX0FB30_9BACL|nr:SRPBCC family protein [Saccharibacillus alkalitolerans]NGZ77269.1 polyketide cyclase [Saccharibacillus alkalitolerans]